MFPRICMRHLGNHLYARSKVKQGGKTMFRELNADEIEARVATVSEKGCSLLLYKDARCDMNILDETVGAMNWMRSHTRDNANCIVSIWDKAKNQWISKEDTGTESFTEKEKQKTYCLDFRCVLEVPHFFWHKKRRTLIK